MLRLTSKERETKPALAVVVSKHKICKRIFFAPVVVDCVAATIPSKISAERREWWEPVKFVGYGTVNLSGLCPGARLSRLTLKDTLLRLSFFVKSRASHESCNMSWVGSRRQSVKILYLTIEPTIGFSNDENTVYISTDVESFFFRTIFKVSSWERRDGCKPRSLTKIVKWSVLVTLTF